MKYTHWTFGIVGMCYLAASSLTAQAGNIPRFVLVTGTSIMEERASTGGVTWVDFDGDGDDDAFVTNGYDVSRSPAIPQTNRLFENVDGQFVPLSNQLSGDAGFSSGSAWADFDNDGLIDLFVPNQREQENFLYLNLGGGEFELLKNEAPSKDRGLSFSATWADVDQDALVDLFVSNGGFSGTQENFFYRNRGNGHLEAVTSGVVVEDSIQSGGATFVDYDLDGDVDLFVPGRKTRMYRNDGLGNFEADENVLFVRDNGRDNGTLSSSWTGAWGDFDNDGDFDLLQVFVDGEPRRLYVNEGGGRFVRRETVAMGDAQGDGSQVYHILWADLNNDSFLDLIASPWGSPAEVYLNQEGRTFEQVTLGELGDRDWFASMVAASDYDLDGDLDLVVGNWPNFPGEGEENLLYRNEGPVGHWFAVRLQGTESNRSAIGARVEVVSREGNTVRTLTREIRSQDGWRSQSSLEAHFGLGGATRVETLRIHWPSGRVQEEGPFDSDQRVFIVESTDRR